MTEKVKPGYTKAGYPMSWLRSMTHEEALKKWSEQKFAVLPDESPDADKPKGGKTGTFHGCEFVLWSSDNRGLNLWIDGRTTYPTNIEGAVNILRNHIEKKLIKDQGEVTDISTLIQIVTKTNEAIKEFFKL